MEDWLLMQGFYYRLTSKTREQLDATAGGSFMATTLGKAEALMYKIASNPSWSRDNAQQCKKSEEIPEKICALSTKMSNLMNWLDQRATYKQDRQAIQDAFNAQGAVGEYLGV
jgi:hypothetical protein